MNLTDEGGSQSSINDDELHQLVRQLNSLNPYKRKRAQVAVSQKNLTDWIVIARLDSERIEKLAPRMAHFYGFCQLGLFGSLLLGFITNWTIFKISAPVCFNAFVLSNIYILIRVRSSKCRNFLSGLLAGTSDAQTCQLALQLLSRTTTLRKLLSSRCTKANRNIIDNLKTTLPLVSEEMYAKFSKVQIYSLAKVLNEPYFDFELTLATVEFLNVHKIVDFAKVIDVMISRLKANSDSRLVDTLNRCKVSLSQEIEILSRSIWR